MAQMSSRSPSTVSNAVRRIAAGETLLAFECELAQRQMIVLKNALHGFQKELRRQIHDGAVLLIEPPVRLGLVHIAAGQRAELRDMRVDMPFQVHRHERRQLHEARVNPPPRARKAPRHGGDQFLVEPFDRLRPRQHVDLGRVHPRVERSRHQGQAARLGGIALLRHDRGGRQSRHRRLAYRHDMRARPDGALELDQMLDIGIETEAPGLGRDVAGVLPVGDVQIVIRQHRPHGLAQQRREMAGHRRHQHHPGLLDGDVLAEMQQGAERRVHRGFLGDHGGPVAHRHRGDAVVRPMMGQTGLGEDLSGGAHDAEQRRREGSDIPGADPGGTEPRRLPQRMQKVVLRLVDLIFHGRLVMRPLVSRPWVMRPLVSRP